MTVRSLHDWRRGPRSSFSLRTECGVYALFLREGIELPGITPGERGLIYIGLAANREASRDAVTSLMLRRATIRPERALPFS